ncbi:uncharacterized protein LOC143297149 [Babylonia areolata]|uniref:uncharacterized protein LOC143297149 n=1 Tax=Babylonia areolata TaxID=304850 RepID=UPI003FD57E2C
MPVPPALTLTSSAFCLLLTLTLTSASSQGWGVGGGRGGGGTGRSKGPPPPLPPSPEEPHHQQGTELCDNARLQCTVRTGCQMALTNFFQGCQSVLVGGGGVEGEGQQESACPTRCGHALVSLLTSGDGAGRAFMHCDCRGQAGCEERKRRVQVCQGHVLRAMERVKDGRADLSCSLARGICEADTSCLAALRYYARHCGQLLTGGARCTSRCRNSVLILYRQPRAAKLRTCRCQGDEDYDCPRLLVNTERLCLQSQHRHHHHSHHHHHHHTVQDEGQGEGQGQARYRRPGRQPASPITQSHTSSASGQSSSSGHVRAGSSGGRRRRQQGGPLVRRQRRNKPGGRRRGAQRRRRRGRRPPTSLPVNNASTDRVLKRRSNLGHIKVTRSRRRRCPGGRRGKGRGRGQGRKKRRSSSSKHGRAGRRRRQCRLKKSSRKPRSVDS